MEARDRPAAAPPTPGAQTSDRGFAFERRQPAHERLDARRLQKPDARVANANAAVVNPHVDAAPVCGRPGSHDVSLALQPIERERHRGRHHPHMPGQTVDVVGSISSR